MGARRPPASGGPRRPATVTLFSNQQGGSVFGSGSRGYSPCPHAGLVSVPRTVTHAWQETARSALSEKRAGRGLRELQSSQCGWLDPVLSGEGCCRRGLFPHVCKTSSGALRADSTSSSTSTSTPTVCNFRLDKHRQRKHTLFRECERVGPTPTASIGPAPKRLLCMETCVLAQMLRS